MAKIYYLGASQYADLKVNTNSVSTRSMDNPDVYLAHKKITVMEHPEVEIYSLEGFIDAFNSRHISDLGFVVLVER